MSLSSSSSEKPEKTSTLLRINSTSQYLLEFGKFSLHIFPVHLQQATCILCDASVLFIRHKFLVCIYFDGDTGRSLQSICLIIFLQDHVLFPIFRANTNYIFLNWGYVIYSCLLCSRISVGEVYYLPVSNIQQIIQYCSHSFPH